MWCLIVSIPVLCPLSYFDEQNVKELILLDEVLWTHVHFITCCLSLHACVTGSLYVYPKQNSMRSWSHIFSHTFSYRSLIHCILYLVSYHHFLSSSYSVSTAHGKLHQIHMIQAYMHEHAQTDLNEPYPSFFCLLCMGEELTIFDTAVLCKQSLLLRIVNNIKLQVCVLLNNLVISCKCNVCGICNSPQ